MASFGPIATVILCSLAAYDDAASDKRVRTPIPARAVSASGAQDERLDLEDERIPFPREGEEARLLAVSNGLRWLSTRQESRDGSVEVGDAGKDERAPLAVTSLAALAWMAGGSTPTRGEYQENVLRAVEYLLANTHRSADTHPGYIEDREDAISRTHGHGLATLALAQAYTSSPGSPLGRRMREALLAAVKRIEVSQGTEGGWYYEPYRMLQHEGSVTVSLVQALRAAKDVGLRVEPKVIAKAVDYVERLQVMELATGGEAAVNGQSKAPRLRLGGFRYGLSDPKTSVALTAAGLATLQAAGVYDGPRIQEGYDYVWRQLRMRADEPSGNEAAFPYYERFYLSQALWHHREERHFREWVEPIMRELIAAQEPNGKWDDVRYSSGQRVVGRYGSAYATACNVLFLTLPDDGLPLFHR